jgi:hypothetical protein
MTELDLEYTPTITPISRPTHDTPEAVLAAALHAGKIDAECGPERGDDCIYAHLNNAAAILAAMPDWTLVNDEDFHAELTDDELATCAAMNFGAGLAEGRKESEAEITHLREASGLAVEAWDHFDSKTSFVQAMADLRATLFPEEPR